MARRTSEKNSPAENVEAPAEATEAPANTEAPAEAKPEKAEEKVVDLTAFTEALDAAVAEADVSTGDVPEASLSGVTTAYRALDGIKAKNAAKNLVNERMKDRMNTGDLAGARANLNISEKALVAAAGSGGGGGKPRPPADPTENFVQRVATLQLAYGQAVSAIPEGVKDDWQNKVSALATESQAGVSEYTEWLKADHETRGDEPDVSVVVKAAAKLAQGKSAKAGAARQPGVAFEGPRRDIAAHIQNAFLDKEDGDFMSIAEIRNTRSEEYGDNLPSAGAISVRLFPASGKDSTLLKVGIRPDTQDNKKGAVKDSSIAE